MKALLTHIAQSLVDNPEQVQITEIEGSQTTVLELRVAKEDNAVVERFFGSLKTERVVFTKYRTRNEAKQDIIDYIEMFYNSKRSHSYLGYFSPLEFELEQDCQLAA